MSRADDLAGEADVFLRAANAAPAGDFRSALLQVSASLRGTSKAMRPAPSGKLTKAEVTKAVESAADKVMAPLAAELDVVKAGIDVAKADVARARDHVKGAR